LNIRESGPTIHLTLVSDALEIHSCYDVWGFFLLFCPLLSFFVTLLEIVARHDFDDCLDEFVTRDFLITKGSEFTEDLVR
jgi:hypothetical protein